MSTARTDEEFRVAFESCSLARDDWDHRAHVRLAWLYLREVGLEEATTRMKDGIYRYDEGTDQICNYHETLTRFWMVRVAQALEDAPEGEDFDAFMERCPSLGNKRLVLQYYSQPRVVTDEARDAFVEPDLRPLEEAPEEETREVVDLT
jgi:hypothetical protein